MGEGSRWPRVGRALLTALLLLIVAPLALLVSVLYHVDTDDGRWAIAGAASTLVSELLAGDLEIEEIEELNLSRVVVEGASARDASGTEVARIGRVEVELDAWALLDGEIRARRVLVEDPWAFLGPGADDESLAIVDAFMPVATDETEDTGTTDIPVIRVDHVRVHGAHVTGLPNDLEIVDGSVEGTVDLDPEVRVTVASTRAELTRRGERIAALSALGGHFETTPGTRSEASLRIESGADFAEVDAGLDWTEDGPGELTAEVRLDLSPALADVLEVEGLAEVIDTGVRGSVQVHGTIEDAELTAHLETDGGALEVTAARHGETLEASAQTEGLDLGEIVPALEGVTARGEVEATVSPLSADERTVVVTARDVGYDEWLVPEARVRGTLSDEGITVEEVSLPHLAGTGGHIGVSGTIGREGDVDVRVDARIPQIAADPNLRRLAPGVRAALTADVRAQISSGEEPTVDFSGRVRADGFRAPGVSAQHLDVRGTARGRLAAPVVNLTVDGRNVRAGDVQVQNASLRVQGGPRTYRAEGSIHLGDDHRLELDATAEVRGGEYWADATLLVHGIWPDPVRVALTRMRYVPDRFVTFENLSAESRGLSLDASGRYGLVGDSDLRAEVATLDLERLGQALGKPFLTGNSGGSLRFGGTVRQPEIVAQVALSGVTAGPFEFPALGGEVTLSSDSGEVMASVQADAAGYGRVSFDGRGALGEGRDVEARLLAGEYRMESELTDVPAAVLSLASPDLPPFDGTMNVTASVRGEAGAPEIDLVVDLDDFAAPGVEPLAIELRAHYESGQVALTAGADDAAGPLVTAQGQMAIDVPAVIRGEPFDPLAADVDLAVSLPSRRLDQLPEPLTIPLPVNGSAEASIHRRGGQTEASIDGRIQRYEGSLADEGCTPGPVPTLTYRIETRDGRTVATMRGETGGVLVGSLSAEAETPVDEWLVSGFPQTPPALTVDARTDRLDLARLPGICSVASGFATLRIEGHDLLRPSPRLDVEGSIEALAVEGAEPVELRFAGGLDQRGASIDLVMHDGGRSILEIIGTAPVTMGDDGLSPALRDEAWQGELRLDRAPAGPVLGALPWLAQPRGHLHGNVSVRAQGDDIDAHGEIALRDLSFVITDPLIRVEKLRGAIGFDEGSILLRDLRIQDRDGSLGVDGSITMNGLSPRAVAMTIETSRWPLRADGVVYAILDSEVAVAGELDEEAREFRVALDEVSVQLPEESAHSVQPLGQHPDVIYEDQPGFHPGTERRAAVGPTDEDFVPTRILIDATQPFWIRRDDFAIQLRADLRLDLDQAGTRITGPVRVKRGFLNLVGRAFDLEEGDITFDGAAHVDPTLDLSAVHTLQSRETVTVSILGRLSDPRINFTTTVAGIETEAEVIELLVSGHGGSSMEAKDQAVSVLGGMTAGFISSMTRRSTGAYIPRLSIESGAGGSTRVRAGINADSLIPDFLDDVVQSAYVEGFVGSSQQQTSAAGETTETGAQGGFLIELYWPRSIVTTGMYEQPSNWAVDITWEP